MLYDKIKELAEKNGISIYRIERDVELSNGTISKWNKANPNSDSLLRVASYLGVSMEELLKEAVEKTG